MKITQTSAAYLALKEEGAVVSSFTTLFLGLYVIYDNQSSVIPISFLLLAVFLFFHYYGKSRNYVYAKDKSILAYFPFKDSFVNLDPTKGGALPITNKRLSHIVDRHGVRFNKDMCAVAHIQNLPSGKYDRAVFSWFRFANDFDFSVSAAHFLFAFGEADKQGEAFGFYYGSPQIDSRRNEPPGLRLFLYSQNSASISSGGDSEVLFSDVKLEHEHGVWYYIATSYNSEEKKLIITFGKKGCNNYLGCRPKD